MKPILDTFKECMKICEEIMRTYRFEDDISYGARLCRDDIKKQMEKLSKDFPDGT